MLTGQTASRSQVSVRKVIFLSLIFLSDSQRLPVFSDNVEFSTVKYSEYQFAYFAAGVFAANSLTGNLPADARWLFGYVDRDSAVFL